MRNGALNVQSYTGIEERRDPARKVAFDKKLPGYWLARIAGGEERWVCTPTVAWASERGQTVTISEAHVWTRHGRAMETWYERLREARAALQADTTPAGRLAKAALKYTYSLTISGFNSPWHREKRSPLYRPDWRHAICHARWRDAPLSTGPAGQRVTVVIAAGVDARVRVDVRAYSVRRGADHPLTLYHHVEVARANTAGRILVTLPLPIGRDERVRVGAIDLDSPTWGCVRSPRLVACAPGRPRAGSPATSGQATDGRSLP